MLGPCSGFAEEMEAAKASASLSAAAAAAAEPMHVDVGDAPGPSDPKQAPGSAEPAQGLELPEVSPAPEEKLPPAGKAAKGKAGRKCDPSCLIFCQARPGIGSWSSQARG